VKHHIIAAKLGYDGSVGALKDLFKYGLVSKGDFALALRGHQAAVDATKSPQRKAAEEMQIWGCVEGRCRADPPLPTVREKLKEGCSSRFHFSLTTSLC